MGLFLTVPEIGYNSCAANFNLFKDLKVEVCGFSLIVVLSFCSVTLFFFLPKTRAFEVLRFSDMPECPLKVSRISDTCNRISFTHTQKWKCGYMFVNKTG